MTPLDPVSIGLSGVQLIEASAGTGKTHTITTLFVRLVLERRLSVDRILVVTFTNAATAELRDRIRRRLNEAAAAFATGTAADPALRALVARSNHRAADLRRLETALAEVDEAAVHTIHGFCQRVLAEHAFEGGVRPDLDLVADIRPLVTEIVYDFFSRELATAHPAQVEYARAGRLRVADLVLLALVAARLPDARVVVNDEGADLEAPLSAYCEARRHLAELWPAGRDQVALLLQSSVALNRNKYSEKTCQRLVAAVDALVVVPEASIAGFTKDVARLSSTSINEGVKNNQVAPKHMAFGIAERLVDARRRLEAALEHWAQSLEGRLAAHVRTELPKRSREKSTQSFDDVLTGFRDALRARRGRALAAAVRRKFPAALIDEFHDTDPVQYEIFRTLYRSKMASLFLIGDPKQAIYAFRGADVFAYLGAAADADARFTLGTNHRSDPTYVRAVNTMFTQTASPFLIDAIGFEPVTTPAPAEDRLRRRDEPWSGLDVLFVPRTAAEPGKKPAAPSPDAIPKLTAGEIARMLDPAAGVTLRDRAGFRALEPGDFAVLTRTNAEAGDVQRALRALGVPSVLHGDSNVLDTDEAAELSLVLAALADPSSATAVRSALATSLLGLDAAELFRLGEDEAAWEQWTSDFANWHATWKGRGFLQAVRRLMRERRTSARLLGVLGGERKLTNFLHLTEICHRQAMDRHLGIAGLMAWLAEVRHDDEARDGLATEAQQIRLESDDRAVQLTTMHRSKGLEYPVVVLPYLWKSAKLWPSDRKRLRYHDPARAQGLVLDLRSEDDKSEALERGEEESMAEGLRLAYVALTRARHRSLVVWGAFYRWHESAVARLLHPETELGRDRESMDDPRIVRDLAELVGRSSGAITVRTPLAEPPRRYQPPAGMGTSLSARPIERRLSSWFRTSSFSALTAGAAELAAQVPERDIDPAAAQEMPAALEVSSAAESAPEPIPLDDFPRGPRAGNLLHAILEDVDFERRDPEDLARRVNHHLSRRGFDRARWEGPLTAALADVLDTPLVTGEETLRLCRVPRARRCSEMEFTLPVAPDRRGRGKHAFTAEAIAEVLAARGRALPERYAESVGALGFAPLSGFLRGFIDLVFEHGGKYYLVDYKSNHLGSSASSYSAPALAAPMTEHHYYLQYHLYLVALHRHLNSRLPGYAYGRHMGGALYLFLRGMSAARGPSTGVFTDLPEERTIEALSRALERAPRRSAP